MDERTERILGVAMELAERDGYDAVRLRDVAAQADVALGTVYRRFSCKEDILAAVLNLQVSTLKRMVECGEVPGKNAEARLGIFFEQATMVLAERPKLAAAMLRTVASGDPHLAERVTRYHGEMTEILLQILRGDVKGKKAPTKDEKLLAQILQNLWFASLVGWTGGLHDAEQVVAHLRASTRMLMRNSKKK